MRVLYHIHCVFSFNVLALVVSEILWGPKITLGALCHLDAPSKKNYTQIEYFTISNCVFNFNFLALVFSEILGGFQIYTSGTYAALTPPRGEIFGR